MTTAKSKRKSERQQVVSDMEWWEAAGKVLGLGLMGFTYRFRASFTTGLPNAGYVEMPGIVAERLHEISRSMAEAEARGRLQGIREAKASRLLNRVECDEAGELDEVCTDGGAHLERMSKKTWFLSCERADGSSFAVWFTGKINLTEEREAPSIRALEGRT